MDYAVGKLFNYLRQQELDDNTIILFSSDNGSMYAGSNTPFRGEKCFQYEGGTRVPFIAYWKDKIPSGTTSDVVGHFTDVLPTLASISKSEIPEDKTIDGVNIEGCTAGQCQKNTT